MSSPDARAGLAPIVGVARGVIGMVHLLPLPGSARWGGSMEQHGDERSFYPYFFPPCDEPGITARLVAGLN